MAYVSGAAPAAGCIFCAACSDGDDRKHLVLRRCEHAYLILNAYPYASGHLMAVLNRHVAAISDATAEELADLMRLVQLGSAALLAEYAADGLNIGINQGRVAGAGVVDHMHVHVVPRWQGDTNFMPVLTDVRVLPEALGTSYDRLKGRLAG